ncbi:uncharacterized protein CMU_036010 [Cryptosporidium muris RN66]|uniref:Uncharacterized protein n=1 Tax=Cryptosporidium muris (strain RN66) TaxID=441375 RepID=B6AGT7_CRYMR|nr:uncharacterized protein CMU_036010 [Cryptosporidium muris RN66]EEA07428.1 hypothetical protein, conserved [Cryptosporidium muris RN66]|eukprot:XP_002141777.1 hypothetical protein [Cryptosporidium muris RN66]
MPTSSKIRTAAVIAGGAAAIGALLYYLFKDEGESRKTEADLGENRNADEDVKIMKSVDIYTRDDMITILDEILESQNSLKAIMRELTERFKSDPPNNFQECYEIVRKVSPKDPLEQRSLSISDFDRLVERFYGDEEVCSIIEKIMGINGLNTLPGNISNITKEQLIKVNELMLKELREFVDQFIFIPNKEFDMKTLTITAQVWVSAKVESQFDLNSDDIEAAMLMHSHSLRNDPDFSRISFQMQATMEQLLGVPAPSSLPFSI